VRNLIFCHDYVGTKLALWLLSKFPEDISTIVVLERTGLVDKASQLGIPTYLFQTEKDLIQWLRKTGISYDSGFLLWWPKIISEKLIKLCKNGFINTHPSLLPFNRGKHTTFWALVEQSPFGVSLHYVDEGIDSGPVIAQKRIPYTWEDTAETLYDRAREEIILLFQQNYDAIRHHKLRITGQSSDLGSFHAARELNTKIAIHLDEISTARKLLNLLRARVFTGYPGCYFEEGNERYEVQIKIRKVSNDSH
jgi:methionyl-tRNA formyltransferase